MDFCLNVIIRLPIVDIAPGWSCPPSSNLILLDPIDSKLRPVADVNIIPPPARVTENGNRVSPTNTKLGEIRGFVAKVPEQ